MNPVKKTVSRSMLAGLLFLALASGLYAQNGGRLGRIAILPFSGGTTGEREGIPELFMTTSEMLDNFLLIPRTGITTAVQQEQSFQSTSGMTNADTIARLGIQFGADYVMAGSITSLGSKNLLIVSIVRIDVIRQVAGVYLTYDSLDELDNDESIRNKMAEELVKMARNAADGLDKLALLPVELVDGGSREEGDALAQILAIHLLRAGRYAVYPRTKSLEQVQGEYDTQLKGGVTRTDEAVKAGEAENPSYALSVISRKIGTGNRFNATVIDLEEGVGIDGDTAPYTSLSEGMYAMESLAATLSASVVSEEEPFGKIAILPFSGGTQGEREGIPELLSFTMMRDFSVIPRTSITDAARQEQSFQATSGMTNADTIARLGNQLGADYVLAGSITSLGSKNLLIVSIVRIDVIRQVAGVYLTYDSLDELNNDETILKNMAEGLVKMARNATDGLDKLALLPVELADGGSREEGDTLAQILAIHLLRAGKYAVYPRTKSLEQVQGEYDTQLKGGVTRTDEAVKAGEAENPSYALSVISRKIGTGTRFNASIIDLEGGYTVMAKSEQYTRLSDGMYAMEFLARELSGGEVTARQREERLRMVEAETEDEDQTERARARAEATDKFLKNSGIILGGWAGMSVGGSRVSAGGSTIDAFRGGAIIELRPYDNLIGIQTGVNVIADNMPYPGRDGEFAKLTTVQLPILFRFNLRGQRERNNTKIRLMAFGGVGLNLFAGASDAVSVDPVPLSVIAGGGLEWYGYQFSLALMYQYNGDIGGSSLTAGGISHEYTRNSHLMGIVLTWYIRFRKDQ